MKRIYTTVALLGALVTGAFAQKEADLAVEFLNPTSGQAISNTIDSITYSVKITNNGPDTIKSTQDTITWVVDTRFFGCELPGQRYVTIPVVRDLNPGTFTTVTFKEAVGAQFWADANAPKVSVSTDATLCPYTGFFVLTTNDTGGVFFVGDNGTDAATLNDAFAETTAEGFFSTLMLGLSGNNEAIVTGVKFGSGATDRCNTTSIVDLNGDAKGSLLVYPNPVTDNLNFDYALDKAANITVRIMDISGRTVLTQELGKVQAGSQKLSVNVSSLRTGTYMIEVSTEGKRSINKFNVQK